jgi:ABC-type nitrate/sulfonate/bicarbonate transport system substrate-binding protein
MKFLRMGLLKLLVFLVIAGIANPAWAQETKKIRFAVSVPPHYLPIWLAKDQGLFSKYGLDVEVIWIRSGAVATLGIVSGQLQLSAAGAESVVAARAQGADIELLACPLDADLVYFIARPEIKSPEQLKGKATGVTRLGTSIHFYMRAALKHLGLDPEKDMTILQLGTGPDIAAALESGRIAGAAFAYRNALPFLQRGWPVLVDLTKIGLKYPPSCVVSSRSFVRANPDTVDRFMKAYTEAIHVIKTNPALAKRVYAKEYRETDPMIINKVVDLYAETFKAIPTVPQAGLEAVIQDLAARKSLSKEFLNPDLYKDDAPLQKLIKEGWFEQWRK